jgi:uncharacterized protein involved in exopolysaccharide biosynthesis
MTDRDLEFSVDSLDHERAAGLPEFLRDPIRAIRRRWPWMLAALLAGLAVTAAFSLTVKPRFLASAILLVSSQQIPEEFVRPTVRDDLLERMNAMVGNVLSRDNLGRLIEKHDLYVPLRAQLPMSEVVRVMRDEVSIEMVPGVAPGRRFESASRVSISFTADDPNIAAIVANDLASLFAESSIESREQRARLTTEFLRRQLANAERELREQERMIREFKEEYRGELPDELEANLRKLEQLQAQRQSLAMQAAETETRLAMILSDSDSNLPDARLATLKNRLAEETAVHTERHPDVISLRREIAALEAEIEADPGETSAPYATRSTLVSAERRTLAELHKQRAATEAQLREIDVRVANTPKRQEELNALEEKVGVLRGSYREFLRKVQDAELAQNLESAQQGERVTILDPAAPPARPERNRRKYLLAGIAAAFGFSLAVGFMLELADPVVVSSDHAETAFGLPVLGSVNRIG